MVEKIPQNNKTITEILIQNMACLIYILQWQYYLADCFGILLHCFQGKKWYTLFLVTTSADVEPIFKILSLTDPIGNSLCTRHREFHLLNYVPMLPCKI